ncbi:hypothetical protein R3P38DRAFT_3272226 [Favolaschia claudopus]|uniref:Uncharacterized protein n=1 Tax=Favolaschia claudopus TaxID=2862362 RepID=A0AAW0B4R6_9AGAR
MTGIPQFVKITVLNAHEELKKAQKLLAKFTKTNGSGRVKLGGNDYKAALVQHIRDCQQMIATPSGSPNDLPVRPDGANDNQQQDVQPPKGPNPGPANGAETINPKQRLREGDIDPQLLPPPRGSAKRANPPAGDKPDAPPNKKSRTSHGQQYRKILNEDPLETAKESINAVLLSGFSIPWAELGATVQAAKPSHPVTAKKFASLLDGAIGLIDHVTTFLETTEFSAEQIQWNVKNTGGSLVFSDLISVQRWLVHAGLMAEKKRPTKDKGSAKIFVYVDGKKREMTDTMMIDARKHPSMWPECVEQGMDAVTQVLKNRSGRSKCITCQSAQRGIKLENRPIPHRTDHPYLEGCKCPIRGAALELWMIKVTAEITGIPQRGDDDIRKGRLALNPDILKVIAAAIKAASGHEVETLLQPEFERLIHTVIWGLDTLKVIAENEDSKYSKSFDLLLKKFNETIEVWKKESEDSDSDSSSSSSSDSDSD